MQPELQTATLDISTDWIHGMVCRQTVTALPGRSVPRLERGLVVPTFLVPQQSPAPKAAHA
jgi:hypothetical protein